MKKYFSFIFIFVCLFFTSFSVRAAAPTAGQIGYWNFNEGSGTTAADSSGNGNTATLVNGTTWTNGKVGSGALSFDGSNDSVLLPNIIGTQDITFCAWVFAKSGPPSRFESIIDNLKFGFYIDTYNNPTFSLHGSSDGSGNGGGGSFQADTWTNLCISRSGSAGSFFINGALAGSGNFGTPANGVSNPYIGQYANSNTQNFYGKIDDVRLYNRVLSAEEITNIFFDTGASSDSFPPIISGIAASSITSFSANISWNTDEPSDSQVEYGLTASYGSLTTLNPSLLTSHTQILTSLTANTAYNYRLKSRDAAGNLAVSPNQTFTTGDVGSNGHINALSCSGPDVQAAINAARNGDVVQIPAGTCTWTTQVAVNAGITLQGAGQGITTIIDNVNKDSGGQNSQALALCADSPYSIRLTGLTLQGLAPDTFRYNKGHIAICGTQTAFRVDHITITNPQTSTIRTFGCPYGLIDHVTYIGDVSPFIENTPESCGGENYGDYSWATPIDWGGPKAVYIEDSSFTASNGVYTIVVFDGLLGSRMVIRHNQFYESSVGSHGTDSGGRERGSRQLEVYDNSFTWPQGMATSFPVWIRGGTGVVFNNTVTSPSGINNLVSLVNCRDNTDCGGPWAPFGKCDGTSPYDQNTSGELGYRCVDQPGSGTSNNLNGVAVPSTNWVGNILDPVYIWNNTIHGPITFGVVGAAAHVLQNRDYYYSTDSSAARPGYTPFPYPYPLDAQGFPNLSGVSLTPPPPPPPTPIPGDFNLDHIVNSLDYSLMNSNWFKTSGISTYDLVVDGIINTLDFSVLKGNWGKTW